MHPSMNVEKLFNRSDYKSISQVSPVVQNYPDFTGQWLGGCRADGQEQHAGKEFIEIKNNRDWIQKCAVRMNVNSILLEKITVSMKCKMTCPLWSM